MVDNERPLSREPISACPCDPYDEPCVASFGVSVPKTDYLRRLRRDRFTDLYITISLIDLSGRVVGRPVEIS
jgi:hypothetical protein